MWHSLIHSKQVTGSHKIMKQLIAKSLILAAIILMNLLAGTEFDIFVPSFPELQNHFSLTPSWVEALLSVNFAGYCLSLFFVGGLADRYGRKPIIVWGLATFILGSFMCLWGGSYPLMFTGRFLQGAGVAAPAILSFLIIADTYPLKQQQAFMGIMNGVMNVSVGAAPVVGSYVTLYFHWQGNFMILLALSLVVFVMTVLFVPRGQKPQREETLSLRGYYPIFKSKPLMLLIIQTIFQLVPYWVFVGISPILYMEDLGVSLAHFGYYQGALALTFGIGSILFGIMINRFDHRHMLYISCLFFTAGFIGVGGCAVFDVTNPLIITLAFLPFVIGEIIPSIVLFPLCLNLMPQAKGRITAFIQGGRLVFSILSLQLAGYFYQGSFQNIGLIIAVFIFLAVATLIMVLKNREIMEYSPH